MKALEGEIELREETRALEQAREAIEAGDYSGRATSLADTQNEIARRVGDIVKRIGELSEADEKFAREQSLLTQVEEVMDEAQFILGQSDTGPDAIAAETHAIELLMQTKRVQPNGGGGSGASPGGGGGGTTDSSALALLGSGDDRNANVEQRAVSGATGITGRTLPEEFRNGLDAYFDALERGTTE